jgi:nitrite reductase/ring-hydroxylating ferredoxin subunit
MNVCLHLGGPLEQDGDRLVCAWHNSAWALADGRKLEGPGRSDAQLMTLPTKVIDGVLHYVYRDTSSDADTTD